MPGLRDNITKTFLRFSRRASSSAHQATPVRLSRPDLREGSQLGSYRLLKKLGTGGMGHVYLALDTRLGRQVALKFLPRELTADPVFMHRFQQEARTASALNHPNILTIHEFVEISGNHIIVSEFIDGVTLRVALQRKAVDLNTGLDVTAQVASALTAAHAAGVVHRDLKPTNIMIRPDGYVKVIDFGLAKLTQRSGARQPEEEAFTRPGSVLGTVGYMSPEQARGEEVDERTDIWSLGVILYEIVTHEPPFEGNTDNHIIVSILDDAPRAIPEAHKLPPGLIEIIATALIKERGKRYRTVRQLLADLQRVQNSLGSSPSHSMHAPKSMGAAKPARRFSWLPAPAFLLLLALAFVIWWWPLHGKWKLLGPTWFEYSSMKRVTFLNDVSTGTISPDGKYLAYVSGGVGGEMLHLLKLQAKTEKQLPATADRYLGLTFSPDNKTLYYVLKDRRQEMGRLFGIPITSIGMEPPEPSSMILEDLEGPITFSPDGRQFAFVRGAAEGNRNTNTILLTHNDNPRDVSSLVSLASTEIKEKIAWSPNNDWIAAVTYPERLADSTRATVSFFALKGPAPRNYSPRELRQLSDPVVLDSGALIIFSGIPQGAEQNHLVQLFVPTGEFHEVASDILGFESISASADGRTLASVRADRRSSIWAAESKDLNASVELLPETENVLTLAWADNANLIFPTSRGGNVNLARLGPDGKVNLLSQPQSCVEQQPAAVPGRPLVVYASNCAHGGDDLNLWILDWQTSQPRRLTSGSNYDSHPDVSPDGAWVFYTSWSSNVPSIWKVPVEGGMPVRVSRGHQALDPAVSPDGLKIVCAIREVHGSWEAAILSVADGTVLQRFSQLPVGSAVRWSPDGLALDYIRHDGPSSGIWRQELSGGPPRLLLRAREGKITYFSWNHDGTKLAYIQGREQKDIVLFSRNLN